MIEINNYSKPQHTPRILIIEIDDEYPDNKHKFCGKRFELIFIHKYNKYKEDFKALLFPTISVLDYNFGEIYEYE